MNKINRNNYLEVKAFLDYQENIKLSDAYTVKGYWYRLLHLLEWAGERPLADAAKIRPGFSAFLENQVGRSGLMKASVFSGTCKVARAFFTWAKEEYPTKYKKLERNWIMSLRPPRSRSESAELPDRKLYELAEVIKLCGLEAESLVEWRTQAAAALLFLSGMRIGAYMSLPINCLDLKAGKVHQLPVKGVRTKNRKAAVTNLLNIPELLAVVKKWDEHVRGSLDDNTQWHARISSATGNRDQLSGIVEPYALNSRSEFGENLKNLCKRAGVVYKSPHKLRHGHVVYAMKRASTVAQFKAISQNVMHSSIGITDSIYGVLVADDVHDIIWGLGEQQPAEQPALQNDFSAMVEDAVRRVLAERS